MSEALLNENNPAERRSALGPIGNIAKGISALTQRRDLLLFLARRRFLAVTIGTRLGFIWTILLPLVDVLIYFFVVVVVFSRGDGFGDNAFLTLMLGIIHYSILTNSIGPCGASIVSNSGLLMQVKIEPIILVAANFLSCLKTFFILLTIYLIAFLLMGGPLSWNLCYYPLIMVFYLILVWSVLLLTAVLVVSLRDLEKASSIGIRILMYLSPVVYTAAFIPERLLNLFFMNPIAAGFSLLQWSVMGVDLPEGVSVTRLLLQLSIFSLTFLILAHWAYEKNKHCFTKRL